MQNKKKFYKARYVALTFLRDIVKWAMLAPAGLFCTIKRRKISSPDKRHLIIVRPDGIGDFVLFARQLHLIRHIYSSDQWHITLIGNKVWQPLAIEWNLHSDCHWFDTFVDIDRKRIRYDRQYRRDLAKRLKGLACDTLLNPVSSRDIWGAIIASWISAEVKIAPLGDTANMIKPFKVFYDKQYTYLTEDISSELSEVVRAKSFIQALGKIQGGNLKILPVTEQMICEANAALESVGVSKGETYVVIFPGASWAGKCWPVENFALWAKQYLVRSSDRIVVCGGPGEEGIAAKLVKEIGAKAVNLAGCTTLIGLAGVIAGCNFCLGNDTAAIHISAAFQRLTFCVLGGGHWGRFWPYGDLSKNKAIFTEMECFGCNWVCKYKVDKNIVVPCISSIEIDKIEM